jgi:hypothetical protein
MGWFSKLLGGGKIVEKAADLADEGFHTEQERTETDQKDLQEARAAVAPSHESYFDVFVDGVNRAIRPVVTLWLMGGFIGWWKLPSPGSVDPYWQTIFTIILTFWFGGRAILKDLPAAIKAIRNI